MLVAPGAAVLFVLYVALPFVVLALVAQNRHRSQAFTLWGFLSWLGIIIGPVIMLVAPPGGFANRGEAHNKAG
ncbi:MAG: hypothetical protein M0R74_00390 [Dehalococcoidia bacterium]|nr:hypothetical protein [Dehalococcoidia bacterium]